MTSAGDWTGRVGQTWASEWQRTDRSFAELAQQLDAAILAAAPDGAFGAIDIGCGAGSTAIPLARARPSATVTGVDLSTDLLAVATARGAGCPNLRFVAGDAVAVAQAAVPVDLFVSRHGVMFFADPQAAFAGLRAAAAEDARLVFSCFADPADNAWADALVAEVTGAAPDRRAGYAPGPFAFADPAFVAAMLEDAGWTVEARARVAFSYRVGEGDDPVADAAGFFRRIGPLAGALRDAPDRAAAIVRLETVLARYAQDGRVAFPATAWIWRAHARGERP